MRKRLDQGLAACVYGLCSLADICAVQVSDFGLSRIHIGEKTVATQTYGTVTHMPPELLAEGRLSKAADVCEPSPPPTRSSQNSSVT
jgi:hypothetical protein